MGRRSVPEQTVEADVLPRTLLHHEKGEPQHAQGLQSLVGLGLGTRQGEPFDAIRIDFELSCGEVLLGFGGEAYVLSLRSCFIVIEREGCDLKPHSSYEHRLSDGSFDNLSSSTTNTESLNELGGGLEAEAAVVPVPSIKAKLSLLVKGKRSSARKKEDQTNQTARVHLIAPAGQDRWRVGDPLLGDPRRVNGALYGPYFNERRNKDGEPLPFCVLSGQAGELATLTAHVRGIFGQVLVYKDGARSRVHDVAFMEPTLRRRSAGIEKHLERDKNALRAAVAGLVVASAIRDVQAATVPALSDREFAIARQTLALRSSAKKAGEAD